MDWKAQAGIGLLIVAVAVAGVWLWRDSVWRERIASTPADTVVVHHTVPVPVPVPVVTPNPAPVTIIRPDSARVDSLLSQITNRDSLIRELLSTVGTEQEFVSKDPTGLDISGSLTVLYSPIERHFATQVTLDSVRVPHTVITVTQTIIEDRLAWEWIAGAAAVGIITGSLIAQ